MDSSSETVYVQLLNEGTIAYRPAPALFLSQNIVKLRLHEDYDPYDEEWEFKPGSVVRVETKDLQNGPFLVAVELIQAGTDPES